MITSRTLVALVSIASGFLFGCATPQYNYQPVAKDVSTPPLNTVTVANVGDEMLKQGKFIEREAIHLDRNIKFGLLGVYTLLPGYYVKTGEDQNSDFYLPAEGPDGGHVVKAALADPWASIQLYKGENRIGVVTVFHVHVLEQAIGVQRTTHLLLSDNSFQQTLIYSGKVGSKIKVGYREFSNNLARPAFNNDVDYDLNESTTIGYKGARVEILEATNQFVRYRVLQNFNQAQQ
jgi:hypothetical protein